MNWLKILTPYKLPCNQVEIAQLEKQINCRLPPEYREFLISYNGGHIFVDHVLKALLYERTEELTVANFISLNDCGVQDMYEGWRKNGFGADFAVPIADDGGTGFYFLILDDKHWGQVYFSYKDDFFSTDSSEWAVDSAKLPICMAYVAKTFEEFGKLIGKDANRK